MNDRKLLPGKFVWFELGSRDPKKAQGFYGEVFGWKAVPFPMGSASYDMIFAGETPDTMIGGYAEPRSDREPSRWVSFVSVEDVDATALAAVANGGRIVEQPSDVPTVGRRARIADPQGAELCLFRRAAGDPPDVTMTPAGRWVWNELHTSDTKNALAFYEKVVGFGHRGMDMGPGGTYHIVSRGGVDRGGVTGNLTRGAAPHWLPYVHVDDADATVARAQRCGARIAFGPESIPGVGRVAGLEDPTGAMIAIIKPMPREGKS
jgi:predicted enzyme related to lactoylglutathione lyase